MKVVSRALVVVAALALSACGSVQSSGTDASGHGGSGGSGGSNGAAGAQAGSGAGGHGGTSSGGSGGALAGAGGTNAGRGGVGGAAGASGSGGGTARGGSGGGTARGGSGGQAGAGRGGTGGGAGVVGTCGGQVCTVQEICCGPTECPRCMNIPSNLCPTTCGGAGGASAGRGGAGGSGGHGGSGGGSAGRGGSGGTGGGRVPCETDANCQGFKCCAGVCINPGNDILNCGTCGNTCSGPNPYCANGTCGSPPCNTPTGSACNAGMTCCGSQCCTGAQICCTVTQGPTVTACFDPVNGSCPTGCAACNCAAPSTPVATPTGDRAIADLKVGDLVYSTDHGSLVVVPIKEVHRQPVTGSHRVVEVRLAHGATLRISPRHPTADGRHFSDLVAGDVVDGVRVTAARLVAYDQPFTYDILPDSDSGTYFAGGILIGSTLAVPPRDTAMSVPASPSLRRASVAAGNN